MNDTNRILIELLAMTDATWRPMRRADWRKRAAAVLYEHRGRFAAAGVPWHPAGKDDASRKADQRTIAEMATAGLLTLHGDARRASLRLTDRGEAIARALAGLPSIGAAHATVAEVIRLERAGDGFGAVTSELWLARLENYSDTLDCRSELVVVQYMAAAALCRDWLESGSDLYGRVWYWPTAEGRRIAKTPEPILSDDLPPKDDSAFELYDRIDGSYRSHLRHSKPANPSEIGFLPLPASMNITRKGVR